MLNLDTSDRLNYNDGKNYSRFDNIQSAIKESLPDFDIRQLKSLLWRDKIKDVFMLTKTAEIYLWNRFTLNVMCWSYSSYVKLIKAGIVAEESLRDDNGIRQLKIDIVHLPKVIKLTGMLRRRMGLETNKRYHLQEILGHKILIFELRGETWKKIQKKTHYGTSPGRRKSSITRLHNPECPL